MPNISFLQDECGLSVRQIVQLMKCSKLITHRPEVLKMKAEKADELGVARSSGAFVYALTIVTYLSQCKIDARLNNLRRLGLSQEEVALMISKAPLLLKTPEEVVGTRMKFLIKEHVIPGLHRAYADASSGNIVEIEWFKSI
ncbi:mTERF [Carex littledalei]|uniref:mTERF n=1 Tax=Carex littledalei TaxID=544730 RepID=A0A833VZ72_9POAL|nr:mTERF [Carex littledalei]